MPTWEQPIALPLAMSLLQFSFPLFWLLAWLTLLPSSLELAMSAAAWLTESLAAAAATSLIAWLLTLLAMGLACKEIHTRYGRSKRLRTEEAFMIILMLFDLLYLLATHAGFVTNEGHANAPGHRAVKDPITAPL